MNATLTALNAFLLALNWQGEPGFTYTVQTSPDLVSWTTLPFVFSGETAALSVTLETLPSPVFSRLRFSDDGDTNGNGLPDLWEWQTFGRLDVDPMADPDEDGASTHTEWLAGTDPLDFYDGGKPILKMASGSTWIVPAGEVSAQAVSICLFRKPGEPWPDAPVTLRVDADYAGLLQSNDSPSMAAVEVVAITDERGRVHPQSHDIRFLAPDTAPSGIEVGISAGRATETLTMQVVPGGTSGPPRELREETDPEGNVCCTWSGDPGGASTVVVERLNADQSWRTLLEIAATELPPPDPETGRYRLELQIPN